MDITFKNRSESIQLMNEYASRMIPFVFIISFDGHKNMLEPVDKAVQKGIYFETPDFKNHTLTSQSLESFSFEFQPIDPENYRIAFEKVMGHIQYGNTFLLNLTFPTLIHTGNSLKDIFCSSAALFKLLVHNQFVVFSPERFVRIRNGQISSNPMKGTIDASLPNAYMLLKSDPKEDAEHNTIVDLIRNDLGMVANDIRVKRFKYIEKIKTNRGVLLQMSSEIAGNLPHDYQEHIGEIIFRLLPAGSVTGAPKPMTVKIIEDTEIYKRGFYTGIFGYFDGRDLDSSVMIRFIEKQGDKYVFKSGGGLTFMSKWEEEYNEMISKVYVPFY